jgi:hypothetical protein
MMDAAGVAIATLLPAQYRGAYGDPGDPDLGDARRIAAEVFGRQ